MFLVGVVFQWSGLTNQLAYAFFGSGFCAVLVLAGLTLLNVTANLNIISKAQVRLVADSEATESRPGGLIKTLCVAAILIGLVVGSLWFAERRLYQAKVEESERQIESLIGTTLFNEMVTLIKEDGAAAELIEKRNALAALIQVGDRLSLITPRKVGDVTVYNEWSRWWYQEDRDKKKKISEVDIKQFVPRKSERRKWDQLVANQIDAFSAPNGDTLRSFRRAVLYDQEIILLIDTSRRSDYSRGSF